MPSRLIPARAGKTHRSVRQITDLRAHPRAGGENFGKKANDESADGSSPRGRGKRRGVDRTRGPSGLIPARAGKTPSHPCAPLARAAHPRAGGENTTTAKLTTSASGSSPRGRGKRRSFPASCGAGLAHPRAGGENAWAAITDAFYSGSSPRGRGKPTFECPNCGTKRLIPARAGKTLHLVTVDEA